MSNQPQIVTIFGGSGFVGRYIARKFANLGWRVRVAVRRPNEALFVRTYGTVGQVEPIQANIRDEASIRRAIQGADAVVNCVGILYETGFQKFDEIHNEAASMIARISSEENVKNLVQISAIGANPESESKYLASKGKGEANILRHFQSAAILRPSIIFGVEDEFFNRFARMAQLSPILPIVGGNTKMQPVYVDDVAEAAVNAVMNNQSGVYELGGQEIYTMKDLMHIMTDMINRKRWVLNLPKFVGQAMAVVFSGIEIITFRLFPNRMITLDQIRSLSADNVVADDAKGLNALGVNATAMQPILETYLEPYRPHGEFDELAKQS